MKSESHPWFFQGALPTPAGRGVALVGLTVFLLSATAFPALCKPAAFQVYRVKAGDTLAKVSKRFGMAETALRAKNGLSSRAKCKPGDTLVLPLRGSGKNEQKLAPSAKGTEKALAPEPSRRGSTVIEGGGVSGTIRVLRQHVVRADDTIKGVATQYGVTPERILKENGLKAGTKLQTGSTLVVPVGEHVVRSPQTSRGLSVPRTRNVKPSGKGGGSVSHSPPDEEETAKPAVSLTSSPVAHTASTGSSKKVVGRLGTVVRSGGLIRRAPQPTSPGVFSTQPGNQLVIDGHWGDWYAIVMMDRTHCWIHKKYVRLETTELVQDSTALPSGNTVVVQAAMRYLGCPYRYGGNSRSGIDCSALVKAAYAAAGHSLPRTAAAQFGVGYAVPPDQLQPGDRLYFTSSGRRIDHCGIYIGNGQMIHASGSRGGVVIEYLFSPKQWAMFRGARR